MIDRRHLLRLTAVASFGGQEPDAAKEINATAQGETTSPSPSRKSSR